MLKNIGIERSSRNRWIRGVCAGIAHSLGVDPVWVRVATVLLAVIVPGISFIGVSIVYVALGFLLPESKTF
jgi:phage shock protein PspC (stress-responsive transcriptional regulator)